MNQPRQLRVVRVQDGVAVGEIKNVCITLWRGPVTRPRFDAQQGGLREVIQRHPGGVAFLCIIEPTATPPGDELRKASADMVRAHQRDLRCIACVVEGTGFVNAAARSALSAMALMLGTRSVPLSVFGTVRAAATWMSPRAEVRDAAAINSAAESLRDQLEPWTEKKGRA